MKTGAALNHAWWIIPIVVVYYIIGCLITSVYVPFSGGGPLAEFVCTWLSPLLLTVLLIAVSLQCYYDREGSFNGYSYPVVNRLCIGYEICICLPIILCQISVGLTAAGLTGLGDFCFWFRYHSLWMVPVATAILYLFFQSYLWSRVRDYWLQSMPICNRP